MLLFSLVLFSSFLSSYTKLYCGFLCNLLCLFTPPPFLRYLLVQDWFSESILIAIYCFIIWIQFVSFLYYWWKFLVIFLYSKPQCSEWVYVFPCTNSQQFFWLYSCKWNQQDMEFAYLHFFPSICCQVFLQFILSSVSDFLSHQHCYEWA